VLDRFVIGCGPDPKRADVVDRNPHVDGNAKAADARVDRQACAS